MKKVVEIIDDKDNAYSPLYDRVCGEHDCKSGDPIRCKLIPDEYGGMTIIAREVGSGKIKAVPWCKVNSYTEING